MAEIRYAQLGGVFTSFSKGGARCIRRGDRDVLVGTEVRFRRHHNRHAPRWTPDAPCVQLVDSVRLEWELASVFVVQISEDLVERWPRQNSRFYVVARGKAAVESYLKKRYDKIARRNMGLAKYTLTVAMQQLSTRRPPANSGRLGERAARIARNFIQVNVSGFGADCTVEIRDNLSYAVDAVKGGVAGIDFALKRAANRIAGMIRHRAGARLDEDIPTPFPEVKRK